MLNLITYFGLCFMFHFSGICCFCYVGDGKEIEKRREEKRRGAAYPKI